MTAAADDDAMAAPEPPLAALLSGAAQPAPPPQKPSAGQRAAWRLTLVGAAFAFGFSAVAVRMAALALSEPVEPQVAAGETALHVARAEITDRAGRPLAMNLPAASVYAHPGEIDDPARAARLLAETLSGVDEARLRARFERRRGFAWIKRPISPGERQAVHDLGLPGVYFGDRDVRVYPAGRMAAHVLGGARAGDEGVRGAEIIGLAGAERWSDETLRDPARAGAPLRLSIDLPAQAALTEVLEEARARLGAKGAWATLMDARTGAIAAMVSLPDFDPNRRPDPADPRVAADARLRNRAVEGVYEFGSVFKPFFAALALERGVIGMDTLIDTKEAVVWGRSVFRDHYRMPPQMTVAQIIAKSSNVGTVRMALMAGTPAAQDFLRKLGMMAPTGIDLAEGRLGKPLAPQRWSDLSTITISFGYGLSVSQTHMAAGYAALVNGGLLVTPTLNPDAGPPGEAARVISPRTSAQMRAILRGVVAGGTGRSAEAPGYLVGGKTGTANKLSRTGRGYDETRTLATFAGAFPMNDPRYVLIVTLDEPTDRSGPKPRRTAGATAAPTAGAAIRRLAPLLGLRPALPDPAPEPAPQPAAALAAAVRG